MKPKIAQPDNMTIKALIGECLQRQRLERGLTPDEVDRRIAAKSVATLAFEQGKRFLDPATLLALSHALKTDIDFFFPDADHRGPTGTLAPAPPVIDGAQRLLRAYYRIEDSVLRRRFIDLVKDIAKDESMCKPDIEDAHGNNPRSC